MKIKIKPIGIILISILITILGNVFYIVNGIEDTNSANKIRQYTNKIEVGMGELNRVKQIYSVSYYEPIAKECILELTKIRDSDEYEVTRKFKKDKQKIAEYISNLEKFLDEKDTKYIVDNIVVREKIFDFVSHYDLPATPDRNPYEPLLK